MSHNDSGSAFLGVAALGLAAFLLYCGYSKVCEWVCPDKPQSLTYTLEADRAVFETKHGRLEKIVNPEAKESIEALLLQKEVNGRTLKNNEIYRIYEEMDKNRDNVVSYEEAKQYKNTQSLQ